MPAAVIVGAGEAGTRAALTLRDAGWTGPVTLVGEETQAPYERPPLSKTVMTGETAPAVIASHARLEEAGIVFRHSSRVAHIDRVAQVVVDDRDEAVPYDALLIATGARPRRLGVPGAEHGLYLRSFADALVLRERLPRGAHLLVVGGGFIGLEIAASAVARGCRVTLIEAAPRLLTRGVPIELAARVEARHRAAGVSVLLGASLAAIERRGDGVAALLADGGALVGDGLIVGIGAVPDTALAAAAGLAIEDGVRADATLRTSDPAIFAAGDCCSFPSSLYGGRRLRLEAWRNAQEQGAHAARTMAGAAVGYDAVPWFWSDQYEQTLQVAGLPALGTTTVRRETEAALLFFHLDADGRLVAASGIGSLATSKDIKVAEMLIARRAQPDPEALASPSVKLRTFLAA